MHLFFASWNFTHASSFAAAANEFVADRSLVWNWITTYWEQFVSWIEQPSKSSIMTFQSELISDPADVLAIIIAWWITFTVVITLLLTFGGFGSGGIIAGRFAYALSSLRIISSHRVLVILDSGSSLGDLGADGTQGLSQPHSSPGCTGVSPQLQAYLQHSQVLEC
jgi:hypothetical protein